MLSSFQIASSPSFRLLSVIPNEVEESLSLKRKGFRHSLRSVEMTEGAVIGNLGDILPDA